MVRKNTSKHSVDYANSIKKSNDLSMAELNYGLNLNQMQLFAFAIFSTQKNGKTEFRKHDFQKKFGIEQYRTEDAHIDSEKIMDLKSAVKDFKQDYFKFTNIFIEMIYNKGNFKFEWNPKIIPHILELKERYVVTDLTITSQFKSGFSWRLYDYLRAYYGYWHKESSKEELMKLFGVEDVKSYREGTAHFKRRVLDIAVEEINEYTELEVWYEEKKVGNKITGFILRWSTGKREGKATEKQVSLLREIHDEIERKMFNYISIQDTDKLKMIRANIMKIKDINHQVNDILTSEKAKGLILEAQMIYSQLENILDNEKNGRDTSFYYNWLEEE